MSVASAATTVVRRQRSTAAMPAADRKRIRTAFAFLAPSLVGVLLFLVIR